MDSIDPVPQLAALRTTDVSSMATVDFTPSGLARLHAKLANLPEIEQMRGLRAHQRLRWLSGVPLWVEDYLDWFPGLFSNSVMVADLILSEIEIRLRSDDSLRYEYVRRFPELSQDIQAFFDLKVCARERLLASRLASTEPENVIREQLRSEFWPNISPGLPSVEHILRDCMEDLPHVPWYRIDREIGRGGTGVVYLAEDIQTKEAVAMKMLWRTEERVIELEGRFRWGAHLAARLCHPNVIPVSRIGECAHGPYLAMEFVEGGSLESHLTMRAWPAQEAARLVEKLANVVHFVHTQGFVHRDIKPGNVLMRMPKSEDTESEVKLCNAEPLLTDFDLAWDMTTTDHSRTPSFAGTPAYMAPEQVAADVEAIGCAGDIYSLGAILYRLLTGEIVPHGAVPFKILDGFQGHNFSLAGYRRVRIDDELQTICLRSLSPEPTDRYSSALELEEALREYREGM